MVNPTLLILAAGLGNKYGGMKNREEIGPNGETILDYLVYDAVRVGFSRLVFVLFSAFEQEFKQTIGQRYASFISIDYILQDKDPRFHFNNLLRTPYPWSSIRALWAGASLLEEPFGVVNAECLYGYKSLETLYRAVGNIENGECLYANVAFPLQNTVPESSSVTRGICLLEEDDCHLRQIQDCEDVEWIGGNLIYKTKDKQREEIERNILTSVNMWAFSPELFRHAEPFVEALYADKGNNRQVLAYTITQMINRLLEEEHISVKVFPTSSECLGIESAEDRASLILKVNKYIKDGIYPRKLWKD